MFLPPRQKSLKKDRKYGKIQESDRREKKVSLLETHYRHEWKHAINYTDLLVIRQRLRAVAKPDEHARGGQYLIRACILTMPGIRHCGRKSTESTCGKSSASATTTGIQR